MAGYGFWITQARRWDECIDFASPSSAWSAAMLDEAIKAREEKRPPSMANVKKQANQKASELGN